MRCITLRGAILGSLFALVLSGCEGSGEITEPLAEWEVQSASLSQVSLQDLTPYHSVARAVALALDDEVVRGELLRSMRMSQYNENKLVLQHFLGRAESSSLRNEVGTDDLLERLAAALPGDVDFYAPSREQRRSWTGSDNFLVAAVGDPDADRALAFGPEGASQIITSLDDASADIVFVIHPAEHKTEYPNRNPRDGDRIEDPPGPALFQQCNEEWCSGGGGGAPPPPFPPGTYENQILPCFNDGPFGGNLEIYFITRDDNGVDFKTTPRSGVVPNSWNAPRIKIWPAAASSSLSLTVHLWEDDPDIGIGGDDDKGQATVNAAGVYSSIDIFGESGGCEGSAYHNIIWANYEIIIGTGQ